MRDLCDGGMNAEGTAIISHRSALGQSLKDQVDRAIAKTESCNRHTRETQLGPVSEWRTTLRLTSDNVFRRTLGRSRSGVEFALTRGKRTAMQYRKFGKLGWQVSALCFGCMRFPTADGERLGPNILEDEAIRMVRHAIDNGVNYLDTAYPYHGGQSEIVVGKALRDGYREKVRLATKLPTWQVTCAEDFDRLLDEQLKKLDTTHIDFYLLHALGKSRWHEVVLKHDLFGRAEAALADGRIRHLGFSFHDDYEAFEAIVKGTDLWGFCQLQYNYMDTETQAGTRGLKLAAEKGLAVAVMEPLMGGRLADPPKDVRDAMEAFDVRRSPAEWALGWLWDQPEVSVVLSGMSAMSQVEENLAIAGRSRVGAFTGAEQALIARAREMYQARTVIPCTRCNYCMPCPNGLNIPGNFEHFNFAHLFDDVKTAKFRYQVFLKPEERSSACIDCGICEDICPQQIHIGEWMPKVTALLG